jgi:hypothetical protein
MFDLSVGETSSQRMAAWLPALAGLVAAAGVAWWTCPAPAPNSLTWPGVAALALRYVLLSALAGLTVTWGATAFLMQGGPPSARSFNWRVSAAMVWLPPLALFLSQKSLWTGLASVVVGWQISKSRRLPEGALNLDDALPSDELFRTFHKVDSFPRVPSIEALCSAVCAQGGVFTALLGRPIASATFLGIGSVLVAWSSNEFRVAPEGQSGNSLEYARRATVLLVLAITLTLAGLMRYLRAGGAGDEVAGAGRSSEDRMADLARDATVLADETYRGVILLPEPASHAVLVPPLPFLKRDLFTRKRSTPLNVPFSGVYWLFRRPQSEPPPDSHIARGNPLTSGFRSSGHIPLLMEAHQNFGTLIDLRCCSRIQLAIRSADSHPGFITLELILTNTTLPGRPPLSLGNARIAADVDRRQDDHAPPMQEILSFDVPRGPEIREFDEATIRFHRAFEPDRSARVSIDRFIFVPRGF